MTSRTKFISHVVDDGWNLPYEVLEEIEFRIAEAKEDAYRKVCKEHDAHKGAYLTEQVAEEYQAKSWVYRVLYDNQYIKQVKEIGQELQELYGVTRVEAINIMNGRLVQDYLNKYYRIQNRIPVCVNESAIAERVKEEYFAKAM